MWEKRLWAVSGWFVVIGMIGGCGLLSLGLQSKVPDAMYIAIAVVAGVLGLLLAGALVRDLLRPRSRS
jgi:hypothetical protein